METQKHRSHRHSGILAHGSFWLALGLCLLLAGVAQASDQSICSNLSLSGFNSSSLKTGFTTTDVFDGDHTCSPGNGSSCSACNGYGSPPKNTGFILCIPDAMTYQITSSCQNLLSQGSGDGCSDNTISKAVCSSTSAVVRPSCNWRSHDNKNNTGWNWTVKYSSGIYTVDCSNYNFQGPEQ